MLAGMSEESIRDCVYHSGNRAGHTDPGDSRSPAIIADLMQSQEMAIWAAAGRPIAAPGSEVTSVKREVCLAKRPVQKTPGDSLMCLEF